MTTLLAFIVAIAILVVIHEMGHYWIARLCGVKVLRFSVGFGKTIYSKRFANSETDWVISAIPLGGYVKMLDEREGTVAAHELHLAFNRKPVLQRIAIVVAGPVANLLLAILLFWALFIYGVPSLKPVLGEILPNTPAATAALQAQETIVSINEQAIPSWEEMSWVLLDLALQGTTEARIEGRTAQGETIRHVLNLEALTSDEMNENFLHSLGLQPYQPLVRPVIGKLVEGGVAQRAGLLPNDKILRVDSRNIEDWKDLVEVVRGHPGQLLKLEIERSGTLQVLSLTPEAISEANITVGKIGAAPYVDRREFDALSTKVYYAPLAAFGHAIRKTWEIAKVSLKSLGKMVIGEMSLKNLSGPITIADYAGQSAQMGMVAYLNFLALISISLGVLNLLPIPLLDGGHLLYYMVELIKGSPMSEEAWGAGQKVGIVLLVTLMVLALFNDFSRVF
ncbi:intramembrane zinc metalloprotease RseP [Candidatus Nitrotoga sp. HW29]|uniref:RIP metalloprotease RseP n=1 Tax=Candidatus Nitrotoga sp. HW29 TaxID=2886963 RepID=UPI001EF382C1|nr:RIP metalloprotease RseP [Candidatus Nitrotoga sp. HW29]CAH1904778.1 intramembrane zinc metalloprotease RseP [Candidatus Nitrotoga sp. HW29]